MSDMENDTPTGATSNTNRPAATENASAQDWLGSNQDPDVLLSVPDLGVDKITLSVKDLVADIDLAARVLDLLDLRVGAHVSLGSVELEIDNIRAQAMLKVKLDKVAEIVDRVMTTIDNNPEILTSLTAPIGRGVERLGHGVGEGVHELADRPGGETREIETVKHVDHDAPPRVHTVYVDGRWWNKSDRSNTVQGPYATEEAALKEAGDSARFAPRAVDPTDPTGFAGQPADAIVEDRPDAGVEHPAEAVPDGPTDAAVERRAESTD